MSATDQAPALHVAGVGEEAGGRGDHLPVEALLSNFDRLCEAPDAIPRLRRFILDLAVRGKLVEQDTSDEPGSKLIDRILAKPYFKTTRTKKANIYEPIGSNELPFDLPAGWSAARLGTLAVKLGAGSTPLGGKSVYQDAGVPFLRSQNVHNSGLLLDDVALISRSTHESMSGTHLEPGDVLLNITGASIGRAAIVPEDFAEGNVSQHVSIIRLKDNGIREFIHLSLIAPLFQQLIDDVQVGVSREGLSMQRLQLFPMLVPPLAEQRRIVAKVDELMALCDRLEAVQADREQRREQLNAASLARLNAPAADPEAFRAYATFHLTYLPLLTIRPNTIPQLRQAVLNLSVQGKLVDQNHEDESVSVLITRIQAEQKLLIKKKILKPFDPAGVDETLAFDIPPQWRWTTLQNLIVFGPQNGLSPKPTTAAGAPKAITLTATTSGRFDGNYFKRVEAQVAEDSEYWLRAGDLLYQRGNTREYVGIAAIYDGPSGEFLYPDLIMKVRVSTEVDLRYLHLASVAPHARAFLSAEASGAQSTMPKINQSTLMRLPIPLPPLAEQRRIVAKVDELKALCDRLESGLEATHTESRRLLDSLLHAALGGSAL